MIFNVYFINSVLQLKWHTKRFSPFCRSCCCCGSGCPGVSFPKLLLGYCDLPRAFFGNPLWRAARDTPSLPDPRQIHATSTFLLFALRPSENGGPLGISVYKNLLFKNVVLNQLYFSLFFPGVIYHSIFRCTFPSYDIRNKFYFFSFRDVFFPVLLSRKQNPSFYGKLPGSKNKKKKKERKKPRQIYNLKKYFWRYWNCGSSDARAYCELHSPETRRGICRKFRFE